MAESKPARMKAIFKKYDKNGDGVLSKTELMVLLEKFGSSQGEANLVFTQIDKNHDGTIAYDEFVDWLMDGGGSKNAMQELVLHSVSTVDEIFQMYCGKDLDMDGKTYNKLCKDTGIIDSKFTGTDTDLIFAKVVGKGQRRIDFQQFSSSIELIAEKKGKSIDELQSIIMSSQGPKLLGTAADAVRFHDDKRTYTGTHARGGPENGRVGRGSVVESGRVGRASVTEKGRPGNGSVVSTTLGMLYSEAHEECSQSPKAKHDGVAPLTAVFLANCNGGMDGKTFIKLCKDAGLLGKNLTITDVDLIFAQVVSKGLRRIDVMQFEAALEHIAKKRGELVHEIHNRVLDLEGPVLHGTVADAVRLHDDKSTYTGSLADQAVKVSDDAGMDREHLRPPAKTGERRPSNLGERRLSNVSNVSQTSNTSSRRPSNATSVSPRPSPRNSLVRVEPKFCTTVADVFEQYCGNGEMDGKTFAKLCKDTGLIDKKFTATDADLLFTKMVPKGQRRIDLMLFEACVELVAEKKGATSDDIHDMILSVRGPVLSGTAVDSVRFHDDKATYTGTHVNGGPERVAVGKGTATDSSWKRP